MREDGNKSVLSRGQTHGTDPHGIPRAHLNLRTSLLIALVLLVAVLVLALRAILLAFLTVLALVLLAALVLLVGLAILLLALLAFLILLAFCHVRLLCFSYWGSLLSVTIGKAPFGRYRVIPGFDLGDCPGIFAGKSLGEIEFPDLK